MSTISSLQNPLKALNQVEWHLNNSELESFPSAFLIAGGNLSRQILEQQVFILSFYSGMPRTKYLNTNYTMNSLNSIITKLFERDNITNQRHIDDARNRGPRIRKFAFPQRSLNKWRKILNEPSHFKNPAAHRRLKESHLREFVQKMRTVIDNLDSHLIIAAVNELKSNGKIKAHLSNDENNTPGIMCDVVIKPSNIHYVNGQLKLIGTKEKFQVVPSDREIPNRWKTTPIIIQDSVGIAIIQRLINQHGNPINLQTLQTIIDSLATTLEDREALQRRFRKLGLQIQFNDVR